MTALAMHLKDGPNVIPVTDRRIRLGRVRLGRIFRHPQIADQQCQK